MPCSATITSSQSCARLHNLALDATGTATLHNHTSPLCGHQSDSRVWACALLHDDACNLAKGHKGTIASVTYRVMAKLASRTSCHPCITFQTVHPTAPACAAEQQDSGSFAH